MGKQKNYEISNTTVLQNRRVERDAYIDCCRALAFILVVLHHSGIGKLGRYILGFHMPVFFIITGITFNIIHVNDRNIKSFTIKRIYQLMAPYFIFELINYVLTKILEIHKIDGFQAPFTYSVKSIIFCINNNEYIGISQRLWFLPCMALASILFVVGLHLFGKIKPNIMALIFLVGPLIGSYITVKFIEGRLPFTADISLLAMFYISLGYFGKDILYKIRDFGGGIKIIIILLLLCIYIICVRANSGDFYMYENTYGEYGLAIAASILGSVAFLLIVDNIMSILKYVKPMIEWVNKNSVIMFPIHLEILFIVGREINKLISYTILAGICKTIIVMGLMLPVTKVIDLIKSKCKYF